MLVRFPGKGHHEFYNRTLAQWCSVSREFPADFLRRLDATFGRHFRAYPFWDALARTYPSDSLIFPYWDAILPFHLPPKQRWALCPANIGAIWMNTWGFRKKGGVGCPREVLRTYRFLADPTMAFAVLDERVCDLLQQQPGVRAKIFWLPDFTDTTVEGASEAYLSRVSRVVAGRRSLLVCGVINGIKNLTLLARIAAVLNPERWAIVVAGTVEDRDGVQALVHANPKAVVVLDEYIPNEATFNRLVAEATLIWGAYRNWEGSSNIQIKAGLFGVPILALNGYLMEERNHEYGLGFSGSESQLLDWARDDFELICGYDPQRVERSGFRERFSLENAKAHFSSLVHHVEALPLPKRPKSAARLHVQAKLFQGHVFAQVKRALRS